MEQPKTNVPLEDPKVVAQKAQSATKFLADSIGMKYQDFLKK